jgi:hypothetical protein
MLKGRLCDQHQAVTKCCWISLLKKVALKLFLNLNYENELLEQGCGSSPDTTAGGQTLKNNALTYSNLSCRNMTPALAKSDA